MWILTHWTISCSYTEILLCCYVQNLSKVGKLYIVFSSDKPVGHEE